MFRDFADHPCKWSTTGTVIPLEKFRETASLLFSPFNVQSKCQDNSTVRVTNTTEITYLIKNNTQIVEFSVVTPEQSKHIEQVDMSILSLIQQGDPDLTAYLNEFLRMNETELQNNTFWFTIIENPGTSQDYTPIKTRILKKLTELKEKEKLNPQQST